MSDAKLEDFHIICKLGEGTFSEVMKVKHKKSGRIFAMKKFRKHYMSLRDVNDLQEVYALRLLNPHPCIIDLYNVIYENKTGTVILNFELMSSNLYELISKDNQVIPESIVKQYMYQILVALEYIHGKGIFHRDLKPENILVKGKRIKIADFGSCRDIDSKPPYTEYIATRWYRSPECLLCNGKYSYKMDMWSAGCVLYEIISKNPLFPGNNELDQIHKIHSILGTPDPQVLKSMLGCKTLSPKYTFAYIKGTGIKSLIPKASKDALKLIYDLLIYDPKTRINATKALESSFFFDIDLDDVEISFLKNTRPLIFKSDSETLKKSKSKSKKNITKNNSSSIYNSNSSFKSKSKQNISKNKQNNVYDKKNKENININENKKKDNITDTKNINKNKETISNSQSNIKAPKNDEKNLNNKDNNKNVIKSEKDNNKNVIKTVSNSETSLDSTLVSTSLMFDQIQADIENSKDNNDSNESNESNTVKKVPNFKGKTYKIEENENDTPLDKNLSLTKIFYDNCIENSNKMNEKNDKNDPNNNIIKSSIKMPEIDQSLTNSLSTSINTIFHKNKNITKINNYEYRIINLNDLKNKNNDYNNNNYNHIPHINKERNNHYNNIMAKKKDKKLNQVLKPGGEGMQYLINTLKKYQMIQQKQQQQQQRKKQKAKNYSMQDEEINETYSIPFNKYINYGNHNSNYKNPFMDIGNKNYVYTNNSNNKIDNRKDVNNFNENMKLPIINSNSNVQKKYGIVNQTQMIFKRNNDQDKKQHYINQNQQLQNNQEKNPMFLPSLKKKTKNN